MRVKRLELLGFKSFATKTTVQFEPGVTAIVGPNGSGKSNIVDGIRWVLGEHNPRDVRAPRLEDVIFNGTDTKAPLSMAEVSLMIENERGLLPIAFTELEITRRVYRSGESEYLINHSPCRLKDIQELFLGTGLGGGTYAIIEQGHIDMILSSKPDERRTVFEEASGIARYLSKKQETVRRLTEVEQDLVRAADITQEVKRQVSALERQAAKARQYKTQWEQLKGWELRLAASELRQGAETHEALTQQVESLRQQHHGLEEQRRQLLVSLEGCQAAVAAAQARVQDAKTRVIESSAQIEQHTSQLALKIRWVEELTQQRDQLARETGQLEGRQTQLGEQHERLQAQQASLERQYRELLAQRAQVSDALTQLERALAECATALAQSKASLFEAASEAVHQRNGLAETTLRLQQIDLQVARVQEQHRVVEQRLAALATQQQQLERERQTLSEELSGRARQLAEARDAAHHAKARHHELMGRLHELRERALGQRAKVQLLEEVWRRYEGFPESVKAILADPSDGMIGLLVDMLDPQPGYEQALEAALGPLAYALLVTDRSALRRCQERLASHSLDTAACVVLSDVPAPSSELASLSLTNGGPARLIQFLRYDPRYASLVEWLLGPWLVIEDLGRLFDGDSASLHPALQGGVHGPWVSKTGERMDGRSWQLRGGRANLHPLVARKRHWEEAQQALETLERDTAAVQQTVQEAEARWQSLVVQEERMTRQVEELTPGVNKLDGQLSFTQHESRRLQEELQTYALQSDDLVAQQLGLSEALASARRAVSEAETRQRGVEEAMKTTQTRHDESAQQQQQRKVELAQLESGAGALDARRNEIRGRFDEIRAEQAQLTSQRDEKSVQAQTLADKVTELSTQLQTHRTQVDILTAQQPAREAEADRLTQLLREEERKRDQVMPSLLAIEQESLGLSHTLKEQESQLAERIFRRTRVLDRLRDVYRLEEAEVAAEQANAAPVSEEEQQSLTSQIEHLKKKLEGMGPVSLGSVEEYDQLTARYEFLQAQQQDLLKAQEDLRHSIQQINRTARQQFRDTFAKIQQEFQRYFTQLFRGGQADLILLDEDDVLESGIEIVARPPGKRPQSISLLSGGERALTAIALLFALFKVRPSPFCILDEIDAPLDEANVDRFTKVFEEFLSLSQFILITHNKKTITKADSLYGVTMEQPGISKIVSVKLTKSKRSTRSAPTSPAVSEAGPDETAASHEAPPVATPTGEAPAQQDAAPTPAVSPREAEEAGAIPA